MWQRTLSISLWVLLYAISIFDNCYGTLFTYYIFFFAHKKIEYVKGGWETWKSQQGRVSERNRKRDREKYISMREGKIEGGREKREREREEDTEEAHNNRCTFSLRFFNFWFCTAHLRTHAHARAHTHARVVSGNTVSAWFSRETRKRRRRRRREDRLHDPRR